MNSKWKIPKESRFGIALKSARRVAWGRSDVLFRAILICVSDGACEIKRKASCVCENLLSSSEKRKIIGVLTAFRFLSESLSLWSTRCVCCSCWTQSKLSSLVLMNISKDIPQWIESRRTDKNVYRFDRRQTTQSCATLDSDSFIQYTICDNIVVEISMVPHAKKRKN